MPKNLQLTVKPLSRWSLARFKEHEVQSGQKELAVSAFKDGFPPHQAMFYDGKKPFLACGLLDIGDGQFLLWTLFGENMKPKYVPYFVKYLNNYLTLLPYRSIHHTIEKGMLQSSRMMKLAGFRYVRDDDENSEHWIRI